MSRLPQSQPKRSRRLIGFIAFVALLLAVVASGTQSARSEIDIGLIVVAQTDSPLSKRAIRKLIDEYFNSPTEQRASEIEEILSKEDPALCQPGLKSQLSKSKSREHVLDLAISLGVPKLFNTAKKYIDDNSIVEHRVITLVFTTRDKGSEKFLVDRWVEQAEDTLSYDLLLSAFKEHHFEDEGLKRLKDHLQDKDIDQKRKEAIRDILNFQFLVEDYNIEQLLENWKSLTKKKEELKKKAEAAKYDASTYDAYFADGGVTQEDRRIEIPAGKSIGLNPFSEEQNTTNTELRFKIKAAGAEGTQLALQSQGPRGFLTTTLILKQGKWELLGTSGKLILGVNGAPATYKQPKEDFLKFSFKTTPKEPIEGPAKRLTVLVNGNNFTGGDVKLTTAADIYSFTITAGSEAITVENFTVKSTD